MNRFSTPSGIIATLSADEVHRRLASFNTKRFAPALPESNWRDDLCAFVDGATLEGEFLSRGSVNAFAHAPPAFRWTRTVSLLGLKSCSRLVQGRNDPLFPWLAKSAGWALLMKWFLTQEIAGEAGFEDLTALTQVRFPSASEARIGTQLLGRDGSG